MQQLRRSAAWATLQTQSVESTTSNGRTRHTSHADRDSSHDARLYTSIDGKQQRYTDTRGLRVRNTRAVLLTVKRGFEVKGILNTGGARAVCVCDEDRAELS